MARIAACVLVLALASTFGAVDEASAFGSLGDSWKLEYPDACAFLDNAADECILCHSTGTNLNPYGEDIAIASLSFSAVESMDSDGDGRLNIEEISTDCTLPGDALSVPEDRQTWTSVRALFR